MLSTTTHVRTWPPIRSLILSAFLNCSRFPTAHWRLVQWRLKGAVVASRLEKCDCQDESGWGKWIISTCPSLFIRTFVPLSKALNPWLFPVANRSDYGCTGQLVGVNELSASLSFKNKGLTDIRQNATHYILFQNVSQTTNPSDKHLEMCDTVTTGEADSIPTNCIKDTPHKSVAYRSHTHTWTALHGGQLHLDFRYHIFKGETPEPCVCRGPFWGQYYNTVN